MGNMRRSERVLFISQTLLDRPSTVVSLNYFTERLGAAKSTISEDLDLVGETMERLGLGRLETFAGAAGGVVFRPLSRREDALDLARDLSRRVAEPERVLPGGYVYMSDLVYNPSLSWAVGRAFAARFYGERPEYVLTVETKGIPIALMTARALNIPMVVARRDSRVTEGSAVSINYVTGSARRIQTMSLPRRALPEGARVLMVDDFMKAGGTARGMIELMAEFKAWVAGIGVLVETAEPAKKLVENYTSLVVVEGLDGEGRVVAARPSAWLAAAGSGVE